MTYYFINDGDKELGPFTITQLKYKAIKKETSVWFAGLQEWTPAGQVYELKELFTKKASSPPVAKNILTKVFSTVLQKQQLKKSSFQVLLVKQRKNPF